MRRLLPFFFAFLAACSSTKSENEPLVVVDSGSAVADTSTSATDSAHVDDAPGFDVPSADTTPTMCVKTETVESTCNGLDDDCNGGIDDVDVGKDGICDCLGILILGSSGGHTSSSFEAWLKAKGTSARRRLDSAGGPLSAADVAGIDVVILDRLSRDYAPSEIEVLQKFVKGGGGLVSMTGYDWSGADATRPNKIIQGLGAMYNTSVRPNTPATTWDATHPIAKDMTSVTFLGGYSVASIEGFTSTVVARSMSNSVGVAVEAGVGRMFVWGDEWIEYDSEWATIPEIPKLWANILGWVVQRRCGVAIK